MWLSLVEHYVRDVGAAGSNPVIPTKKSVYLRIYGFLTDNRGVAQLVAHTSGGRDAAGSSPVTPTIPRVLIGFEMFYKHSRFFIAFNQYADNFYSPPSILIIFLLFLFAVFRMSCVTSIFRERLHKLGVKIVFTD